MSYWPILPRSSPVLWYLVFFGFLQCIIYLWIAVSGGYQNHLTLYHELGLSRDGLWGGKVWQLMAHAFLHGNWMHVIMNSLVLVFVGQRVGSIIGLRFLVLVFVCGSIFGGGVHVLFEPAIFKSRPLVGASGGAMAFIFVLITLSPQSVMWPIPVKGKSLGLGLLISMILLYLMTPELEIPFFSSFGHWMVMNELGGVFQYGHAYHFGGAVTGMLFARWLLRAPVTLETLQKRRARSERE